MTIKTLFKVCVCTLCFLGIAQSCALVAADAFEAGCPCNKPKDQPKPPEKPERD